MRLSSARVAANLTAASRGQSTIIEDVGAKPGKEAPHAAGPVHSRPAPVARVELQRGLLSRFATLSSVMESAWSWACLAVG
jgi:hypothetical protein